MNDSFEKIAEKLTEGKRIYLFPHENPDGDAVGSTAALCSMLRGMGKECEILVDEELPANLRFMDDGMFVIPEDGMEPPDIAVAVDCSELKRFPKRAEIFRSAPVCICIDHHKNDDPSCTLNYVDPEAAAVGELIFTLMQVMGHVPAKSEAEALFAAIVTDTGKFTYSNTTRKTHEIAGMLYDSGIDVSKVCTEIYESESPEKVKLLAEAGERVEFYAGGRIAVSRVTQDLLEETGAVMSDAEPLVERIRAIRGVEIAVIFKEHGKEKIYVSFRSKSYADVQKVAAKLGGGGHVKASGCTLEMPIEEAVGKVVGICEEALTDR